MEWPTLHGEPMPTLIGGRVALDFCNTWAGWGAPPQPGSDWIAGYDRFAIWCEWSGIVSPAESARLRRSARRDPGGAEQVLGSVRVLRRSLHDGVLRPSSTAALARVGAAGREAMARARLLPGPSPRWAVPAAVGLATPLHRVALAGVDLLTTVDLRQVRACPGEACGWLFLDPRGRRRWCDMATCGNRAKARAHAARARSEAAG